MNRPTLEDKQAASKSLEQDSIEAAEERVHRPYRRIGVLMMAFTLLPLVGFLLFRAPGLLGGFFLGIVMIAAYPALRGK